jgi:peptidoglycan/xylan/chitin deacetylase (PgdA/CDA1 family)
VRVAIGRVAAALVVLLAAGYLLQMDDSVGQVVQQSPVARPVVAAPVLVAQADAGGREWFETRSQVVPLGHKVLSLPILMYHYIRKPPSPRVDLVGYNLSVAPADFQAQMDWLESHGYHPVDFNDIRAYFAGLTPLPGKPVVITLDDGYTDLYTTAFPILRAHQFKAVAYIVSGFVNKARYVTSDQILEMDQAGIEIADHTVDHANLARSSYASVMYQIVQSKHWLETLIGHPVVDFAYPSGKFDAQVVLALQQAGYSTAVTEQWSTEHSMADRYLWARVRVSGGETLPTFINHLGPTMPSVVSTVIEVEAAAVSHDPQLSPGD